MLFSLNYLRTISNLPQTTSNDEMIEAFNNLGFEVEKVMPMVRVEGLKFGKVLTTTKNPHGDKLTVCEIEFADKKRTIQTTATNVEAGKIIIAFVDGSSIDGQVFATKTLKQIPSEGMLTSAGELGLDNHLLFGHDEGISFYPDITDLTLDPITYLNLNDTIIDLAILPNRADANSYYIMAHELAAYFATTVTPLTGTPAQGKSDITIKTLPHHSLAAFHATNQYEITWADKILIVKSGCKVNHDINDLATLTFLMTGQVVQTYDEAKIGHDLTITPSAEQVDIQLTNETITINKTNLVIHDDKQIINLVGIDTLPALQATSSSANVIFMFGQFPHQAVQKNMQVIKHINPQIIQMSKLHNPALMHFAYNFLTTKLPSHQACVNLPPASEVKQIAYTNDIINEWAGFDLTATKQYPQALASLQVLGFTVTNTTITPPPYRFDVVSIQDLLEEIFRFYNYNNFVLNEPPLKLTQISDINNLPTSLMRQGFNEVVTYLLTSAAANQFNPFNFKASFDLIQPISHLRAQIRHSLVISLQEIALEHLKQKILNFDFYEISQIGDGINVLGLCSSHRTFNDMKNVLAQTYGNIFTYKRETNQFLHPHLSAHIYYQDELVGYLGHLNPHHFNHDVIFCELMITKITDLKNQHQARVLKVHTYEELPLKTRDITIELKPHTSIGKIVDDIRQIANIFDVTLIDKFVNQDSTKVTLRIAGDDKAIMQIDENFNQ